VNENVCVSENESGRWIEVCRGRCEGQEHGEGGNANGCGQVSRRVRLEGWRRLADHHPCGRQLCELREGLHIPRLLSLCFGKLMEK
jgi:hypothetical protein